MVAYPSFSRALSRALRTTAALGVTLALSVGAGCAGIKMPPGSAGSGGSSSGGTTGTGTGSGSGGTSATGSGTGRGGSSAGGDIGGGGTTGSMCQQFEINFEPKIPTVTVLVDRSGSMFPCLTGMDSTTPCMNQADSAWGRTKSAILPVIQSLQADVRFGFVSFMGVAAQQCPMLSKVPAALNNYQAIADVYEGLAFRKPTDKWETPTRRTLETVGADLMADTSAGDKYILFITDGEPDWCDDGNSLCPPDSVIGEIQTLKAAGITTIVVGLQSKFFDLPPGILKGFATAGAGEPTLPPLRANGTINDFFDQCNGVPNWAADFAKTAKPAQRGQTIGTYTLAGGGATEPYKPDPTDQAMLVAQLSAALSGVKSCTFDLGGKIRVDLTQLSKAGVLIEGAVIPLNATDGWHMVNETQLELVGSACATWRKPESKTIKFNFPCEIIVPT